MKDTKRIEDIELQALRGWYEAAAGLAIPGFDWKLVPIGDALCSVSAAEPSILVNRVFGLGSMSPPSIGQLIAIRQLYADAGVSRYFLHVVPQRADDKTRALLMDAGFENYRGWMKFTRGAGDVRATTSDLTVRLIDRDDAGRFAAIAAAGFGLRPESEPTLAALADDPHWHLYMSFDGASPAGTGALYARDGHGYLDWAATTQKYRRRGSQNAILSARIRHALEAGCSTITTMTGEAAPGDPQHSYSNILKAGFSEAYLRENWVPAED